MTDLANNVLENNACLSNELYFLRLFGFQAIVFACKVCITS